MATKRKAYVSGPMTGYPDFNFPAFDNTALVLREQGVEVFSPADHDREQVEKLWPGKRPEDFPGYAAGDLAGYFESVSDGGRFTLENMLKADFNFIVNRCTEFYSLPGWEQSTGARWERTVAEALAIPIFLVQDGYTFIEDPEQKQLTPFLKTFGEPNTGEVVPEGEAVTEYVHGRSYTFTVYDHIEALRQLVGHSAPIAQHLEQIRALLP